MTLDEFNAFCRTLPQAHDTVQWGGAHVWKVSTKLFAYADPQPDGRVFVTFKPPPMSYEILADQPGLRPAPYLASRGLKWLQRTSAETMSDGDMMGYIRESHGSAVARLPKRVRKELGLIPSAKGSGA